jgi:hypothetical protein
MPETTSDPYLLRYLVETLITVAVLFACPCATSHAQECTPQTDQYIGVLTNDGRCFPWRKKQENLVAGLPRCEPRLRGRLERPLLPVLINGDFGSTEECVPIELLRRSDAPRSTSLEGMKRQIDELKNDGAKMKSEHH